jgi:hypothetical protein
MRGWGWLPCKAMAPTPTQRLGDLLLGGDGALERFVRDRRANGVAWRLIARELYETADLDVTHEALRQWFPDHEPQDVA